MTFNSPHYKDFTKEFKQIAEQYSLDPDNLEIEFYTPQSQAILVENVEDQSYKIHINLEEDRIISVQRIANSGNGNSEDIKEKYRRFMK